MIAFLDLIDFSSLQRENWNNPVLRAGLFPPFNLLDNCIPKNNSSSGDEEMIKQKNIKHLQECPAQINNYTDTDVESEKEICPFCGQIFIFIGGII